jgi:solute carrier family 34 (sodium-dependent phosphate cotransporter)
VALESDGKKLRQSLLNVLYLLAVLYLFFCSIELMGSTFKLFGKGFASQLLTTTAHPVVGLFIGILATSVIQSSSTTTSIVVGLVAGGVLPIANAIPIVMGANVGTSVTNTIVSLGHITRRQEFERAIAGATVHDFFNLCSVAVLLPLEIYTGFLLKTATVLEKAFEGVGGLTMVSPLKIIVKPVIHLVHDFMLKTVGFGNVTAGIIMLIVAMAALFYALKKFVDLMKANIMGRVEHVINDVLFQSPVRSFMLGWLLTSLVQSSSITTSLVVPMIGAGVLSVAQFYPYTLGANIGTTVTAIMASLVTGNPAAVTVAFAHLSFNIAGTLIFYPLRIIPLTMARTLGSGAAKNRGLAIGYVVVTFFFVPLGLIFLSR